MREVPLHPFSLPFWRWAWTGSGQRSLSLDERSDVSKPSLTSTWLPSSHPFLQPRALCLHHANARPDNPEQRHREHGRPLQSPDMTTTRVKPGLRALQGEGLQTPQLSCYRDLPKRPLPCSSPLTCPSPHNTYQRKLPFLRF